ncbi:uncharacterized protein LOC124374490 [Homalodisca vitripennis]|uniref:uncharacterized protein LOC124374490 n=1 Tax=Homalodisca vitripennis TaxID=197043 RepID=UPI001EEB5F6C|nr:uncharacterized protein LOC124374490 [Homalodisca vitripennis]
MADGEDWGVDEPILTADTIPVAQDPELPEIKLFCRWNCDDMQVSDMCLQMADGEDWGVDEPILTADTIPVAQGPELPEIKLFCRWNCDDMQVSDMCLQVFFYFFFGIL